MGQTLSEPIVDKKSHSDSNSKYIYGVSCMQGWRLTMEDAHATILKLDDTEASFFGVYDGHGGSTVAEYTGDVLHQKVRESPFFDKKDYRSALKDAFLTIDKDLKEDQNFAYDPSGCTAVTVLLTPENKVFVANAGDSRSVMSIDGHSKALSYDHKPVDRLESQRIVAAGGFVEFGRVNGNLALSRAIGDFEFKQNDHLPAEEQVVTCNPDIMEHQLTNGDEFIVLACDGIWDCMTNQEVVDYIRARVADKQPLEEICEQIMDHCLAPDSEVGGVGCDNMSIVIVGLLQGRSKEEWYEWMASRVPKVVKQDALGNDLEPTKINEQPMNDIIEPSVDEKISLTSSDTGPVPADPIAAAAAAVTATTATTATTDVKNDCTDL
ncbi:phosphatase 2C-like domain-containing protein [Halteromyces radiatus]|uniref:phosphatase 2C-like domain-containing protein n=1 Tax=Halteromyces radiatus TaxID=101107 RepID=UPI00221E76DA|nr:phosphatase 2C-like domain-containing protein [Halteromyces radiatus]KAI8081648.1 phosphatase 2C-like domain-containing protein [Halteromyces radiatus]